MIRSYPELSGRWLLEWKQRCFNMDRLGIACLHLMLGQLPAIRNLNIPYGAGRLDSRVHVLYLSDSGMGKGAAVNFMSEMGRAVGLNVEEVNDPTVNALVGQHVEPSSDEDRSDPDNWSITPGLLSKDYAPPIHIFVNSEADTMFSKSRSEYKENMLNIYQKLMNPMGTDDNVFVRKIGHGPPLKCEMHSSLFLTTFKADGEVSKVISERGFVQRMLLFYVPGSIGKRTKNFYRIIDSFGKKGKIDYEPFIELFDSMNEHYTDNPDMVLEDSAKDLLKEIAEDHLVPSIYGMNPVHATVAGTFYSRHIQQYVKMAAHAAAVEKRNNIKSLDIERVRPFLDHVWEHILHYISEKVEVSTRIEYQEEAIRTKVLSMLKLAESKGATPVTEKLADYVAKEMNKKPGLILSRIYRMDGADLYIQDGRVYSERPKDYTAGPVITVKHAPKIKEIMSGDDMMEMFDDVLDLAPDERQIADRRLWQNGDEEHD